MNSPAGPAHAGKLDKAAETRERPVERARQPRRAVLVARQRRARPLVRAVEEPDAGKAERRGDRADLLDIGRLRAHQPAPRHAVEQRHQRPARPRETRRRRCREAPARASAALAGMAQRAALADVDHRNGRQARRQNCVLSPPATCRWNVSKTRLGRTQQRAREVNSIHEHRNQDPPRRRPAHQAHRRGNPRHRPAREARRRHRQGDLPGLARSPRHHLPGPEAVAGGFRPRHRLFGEHRRDFAAGQVSSPRAIPACCPAS